MTPQKFAILMQKELDANAERKGTYEEWRPSPGQALYELDHHLRKLRNAMDRDTMRDIVEHAADVANICMKIAEMAGGGALCEEPPVSPS